MFQTIAMSFVLGYAALVGMARFSAKSRKSYYGQTMETDPASPDAPERMSRGKRLWAIGFLTVWLFGWTFGVYVALETRLGLSPGQEGYIFMTIWLAAAIPAWFFVVWILFRLYRGDDVDMEFDGDGD